MATDDCASLTVQMPKSLRERARRVAKRLRATTGQLIREGLDARLDHYEAKFHEEDAAIELAKITKREERERRRRVGEPLAPLPRLDGFGLRAGAADAEDKFAAIYAKHAPLILAAPAGAVRRLAVVETIEDVKRAAPLLHPSDGEIIAALDRACAALRVAEKDKPQADAPVAVVDPKRIKTYGKVPASERNE